MSIHPVQFQPGLSMAEFIRCHGTEARCNRALYKWRWPHGFRCPACAGRARSRFKRGATIYYRCRGCRHQTSLTAGTLFAGTKLALHTWMLAIHLLTATKTNLAALELMRHLGSINDQGVAVLDAQIPHRLTLCRGKKGGGRVADAVLVEAKHLFCCEEI